MTSALIIGCRKCSDTYGDLRELGLVSDYEFPFTTAYTEHNFSQLLQFYTCPYCENALYLSPVMLGLLNKFLGGHYHIHIEEDLLEFVSSSISLSIPVAQEQEKTQEIIEKLGFFNLLDKENRLPSIKEIQWIQLVAQQFERAEWSIKIQSARVQPI